MRAITKLRRGSGEQDGVVGEESCILREEGSTREVRDARWANRRCHPKVGGLTLAEESFIIDTFVSVDENGVESAVDRADEVCWLPVLSSGVATELMRIDWRSRNVRYVISLSPSFQDTSVWHVLMATGDPQPH